MMESMRLFFCKYVDFGGRARRAEYWKVVLFNVLLYMPLGVLLGDTMVAVIQEVGPEVDTMVWVSQLDGTGRMVAAAYGLYYFICLIPGWALTVRRLHDAGYSGWWLLLFVALAFLPVVNFVSSLVLVVLLCMDSKPGANKWGESPKYVSAAEE